MAEKIDPQYLKETAGLIRGMAGPSRIVKRELWNYWLRNRERLAGLEPEERKRVFGHFLYESGCSGFGGYAELPERRKVTE
jgi:hypothetical protein